MGIPAGGVKGDQDLEDGQVPGGASKWQLGGCLTYTPQCPLLQRLLKVISKSPGVGRAGGWEGAGGERVTVAVAGAWRGGIDVSA